MNRDDIIRMARKADLLDQEDDCGTHPNYIGYLEHFANLVAAAEREACEKACSDLLGDGLGPPEWNSGILNAVDAIRARGTP